MYCKELVRRDNRRLMATEMTCNVGILRTGFGSRCHWLKNTHVMSGFSTLFSEHVVLSAENADIAPIFLIPLGFLFSLRLTNLSKLKNNGNMVYKNPN